MALEIHIRGLTRRQRLSRLLRSAYVWLLPTTLSKSPTSQWYRPNYGTSWRRGGAINAARTRQIHVIADLVMGNFCGQTQCALH